MTERMEAVLAAARDLHDCGLITDAKMAEFEALALNAEANYLTHGVEVDDLDDGDIIV